MTRLFDHELAVRTAISEAYAELRADRFEPDQLGRWIVDWVTDELHEAEERFADAQAGRP